MSLGVDFSILNQKGTPAIYADILLFRPASTFQGRLFIAIDTKEIYRDSGLGWDLIADAGAGTTGTLQQVTTNGDSTTKNIAIVGGGKLFVQSLTNGSVLFSDLGSGQISQDNTNFFWDNTNKRLGIGTNTPSTTFDIHSTTNSMLHLNQTGLNNSLQTFLLQGVGKWRIGNFYNSANNDFYIFDVFSGTPRFYITNTGYTILPTSVIIGSSNRSSAYGLDSYVSANFQSTLRVQGVTTLLSQINGTFASFSGDLTIATNKFFVNSSTGNVGIGTSSPTAISGYTSLTLNNATNGGIVDFQTNGTGVGRIINDATTFNVLALGGSVPLILGTNGSEKMRITSEGYLQISTVSTIPSTNNTILSYATNGYMYIQGGTTGLGLAGSGNRNNAIYINTTDNAIYFQTNGAGTRMTFSSTGNLLVNTSTDYGYKLVVASDNGLYIRGGSTSSHFPFLIHNSGGSALFYVRGDGFVNAGVFTYNNAVSGRSMIIESGGGLGYLVSTRESKSNIKSITNVDFINQLNPVQFNYRKKDNKTNKFTDEVENNITYGFIADEVENVNKELVFYNQDGALAGVEYNNLIAILTKAIQELNYKLVRNNIN